MATRKALVVDDLSMHRTLVKGALITLKFDVDTAEDGMAALKQLEKNRYDVIFSDIEMPNMNGFEFLARVKRSVLWKNIPVVMLSTLKDDASINRAQHLGAGGYLVKPYSMDKVREAIKTVGL